MLFVILSAFNLVIFKDIFHEINGYSRTLLIWHPWDLIDARLSNSTLVSLTWRDMSFIPPKTENVWTDSRAVLAARWWKIDG